MELPYDPVIPLVGIYLQKPKTLIPKNISAPTFTTALFTIAKLWKQPKCLSTDKWLKKPWYLHAMDYYSAIKMNEILPSATAWTDLQGTMLNEVKSVGEGQTLSDFTYMWNLKNNTNIQTKQKPTHRTD